MTCGKISDFFYGALWNVELFQFELYNTAADARNSVQSFWPSLGIQCGLHLLTLVWLALHLALIGIVAIALPLFLLGYCLAGCKLRGDDTPQLADIFMYPLICYFRAFALGVEFLWANLSTEGKVAYKDDEGKTVLKRDEIEFEDCCEFNEE